MPPSIVSTPFVPYAPSATQRLLARAVRRLLLVNGATLRFRRHDPHNTLPLLQSQPVIFATWHNRVTLSLLLYRQLVDVRIPGRRLAALVSASRDGALLSALLDAFGVQPVRGSTSRRGPQALIELASSARQGCDLAITPDGPRGPLYQVQTGAVAIARVTGLPLVPTVANTRWKWSLRSWDRFQLPLPFGTHDLHIGAPLFVPPDDDLPLDHWQKELRRRLMEITRD